MKKITVAIIGNVHPELMKFSLANTIAALPEFEDIKVFSDCPLTGIGCTHVPIKSGFTIEDYNNFCLKELVNHIKTEFVLIVQYDGMATNKEYWTDEYYNYDYIGAPWPTGMSWITPNERVGNGGFSLRSAKLLGALADQAIVRGTDIRSKSEDAVICQANRHFLEQQHGINFAPLELANQFSHEWCNPSGQTFGFHGIWNIPLYFSEEITYNYFAALRPTKWYDDQYYSFVKNCRQKKYSSVLRLFGLI